MKLSTIDARGLVDLDSGVFYNRIPKAANSVIVDALHRLRSDGSMRGNRAKNSFARPSQISTARMADFDRIFKFTFVRDPYSRTLSAFLDKVHRREGPGRLPAKAAFLQFCQYLDAGNLYQNIHWAPQTSIFVLPLKAFDFVGHVESFDNDFSELCLRSGLPLIYRPRAEQQPLSANKKIGLHYNSESAAIVRRLFADDFSILGYDPSSPLRSD